MDHIEESRRINSSQNGFLLNFAVHRAFDQYLISVNPDDNFKIVAFGLDDHQVDGRILDPVCRDPTHPHRVSPELLRWHFRQSVLANVRGAGEPIFEDDMPPETDMGDGVVANDYASVHGHLVPEGPRSSGLVL